MTKAGFPQQRRSFMTHRRLSIGAVDLLRKKSFMSALTKSDAGQDDFFLKKNDAISNFLCNFNTT